MNRSNFWIGGKHAVLSAVQNKKRVCEKIVLLNEENQIYFSDKNNVEIKDKKFFNKVFLNKDINHQGYAALIQPFEELELNDFLREKQDQKITLLIVDNLQDDRNLGSIIRTSVAFGVDAIIANKREFREKSQEMYKSASGGMEFVSIIQVSNLNNAIENLKKNNVWIYALDGESGHSIYDEKFDSRIALVVGSEGVGIKKLIKQNCDKTLKIPIDPRIDSLNVSNATTAILSILKKYNK
jgi:23S rRNA (guanosine2251-2'-O)-methyltransferase|tara:strand:- start:625 stop:1344 length:720 start_codon:yes stop_codon:yes gene_type:complete